MFPYNGGMSIFFKSLLLVFLACLLSGCLPWTNRLFSVDERMRTYDVVLQEEGKRIQLTPGKTTISDLKSWLGKPHSIVKDPANSRRQNLIYFFEKEMMLHRKEKREHGSRYKYHEFVFEFDGNVLYSFSRRDISYSPND